MVNEFTSVDASTELLGIGNTSMTYIHIWICIYIYIYVKIIRCIWTSLRCSRGDFILTFKRQKREQHIIYDILIRRSLGMAAAHTMATSARFVFEKCISGSLLLVGKEIAGAPAGVAFNALSTAIFVGPESWSCCWSCAFPKSRRLVVLISTFAVRVSTAPWSSTTRPSLQMFRSPLSSHLTQFEQTQRAYRARVEST